MMGSERTTESDPSGLESFPQVNSEESDPQELSPCPTEVMPHCKIRVLSPRTMGSTMDQGGYTTYCLHMESSSSAFRLKNTKTRRRFSEFVWLRKQLNKINNWKSPPPLPPKRLWNLLDPTFVETRRQQLELWLQVIMQEPEYVSSYATHLFLQTEMTIEAMEKYMAGEISEEDMEQLWANQGRYYTFQPHNLLHNSVHHEPVEIVCDDEDFRGRPSASPDMSLSQHHHHQQQQQHAPQRPRVVSFEIPSSAEAVSATCGVDCPTYPGGISSQVCPVTDADSGKPCPDVPTQQQQQQQQQQPERKSEESGSGCETVRTRSTSPDSGFCQDDQQTSRASSEERSRGAEADGDNMYHSLQKVAQHNSINGDC